MPVVTLNLNGEAVTIDADDDAALLWILRDRLGVTGPKYGCGVGVCGACTSHLDGQAFRPCITPMAEVAGREVTTIEGLADGEDLHPVQEAWIEEDVSQCGYCQAGQIMAAVDLLRRIPDPTDLDIDEAMKDNVCRCGTYTRIRTAIKRAAATDGRSALLAGRYVRG
jgi:isoquinoline 1-oxidoreductase alpha subunit